MSTRQGIGLLQMSSTADTPSREPIRVVSTNRDGKFCLPVREVWATLDDPESDEITYDIYTANEMDSVEEGDRNTRGDLDDLMKDIGLHSLRSLATSSDWHVTRIMRDRPRI